MKLVMEQYLVQKERLPKKGKYIIGQYDEEKIVVYQAYNKEIGMFAAENKYFGGEFSLERMSWIKPNFLWVMYRSGWASKSQQEIVLAVSIKREAFDKILSLAEYSSYQHKIYQNEKNWQDKVKKSSVRLQWDPQHDPLGNKLELKAIQLGLRGQILALYSKEWIIDIENITDFVHQHHINAKPSCYEHLL
ncbi:MAG: DUF4291 domain-containing protein [Acidobacteria bacterium]|nr:DUF4291 domain-containing protein [Acidobacteriota bacterium]